MVPCVHLATVSRPLGQQNTLKSLFLDLLEESPVVRREFTWTVFERGYITAEVNHGWSPKTSAKGSDPISAVSKKTSVPAMAW